MGGIGFGNGRGKDRRSICCSMTIHSWIYFEPYVLWVFALKFDSKLRALARGAARYAILNSREAKAAAMGVVARGKQNNFRLSALSNCLIHWDQFVRSRAILIWREIRRYGVQLASSQLSGTL
jgi:hypothetical protein